MKFPENFVWGAASAAYQVEGAAFEDGAGPSVWDMMSRKPGKIYEKHHGNVACDHYHRYQEDVALMEQIGLKAYRFSISWPRVIPDGIGAVNAAGLGFYDRLVDELLSANIEPYVTLFHWDYPYALYCKGGWLNPDSPQWFADYTKVIVDALSDRVKYWMTLNEPQVFIHMGHQQGRHAPGDQLDLPELLRVSHHVLLAHGCSVQTIRQCAKQTSIIGAAPVGITYAPTSADPTAIEAARQKSFAHEARDIWSNSWFGDPMILGHYPEDGLRLMADAMPVFPERDMDIISQPVDFFGCNLYQIFGYVELGENGEVISKEPDAYKPGYPRSTFHWPVTPEVLYWAPRFFYERYQKPIIITENGIASMDWVTLDGTVPDYQRIDYMSRYLVALRQAIQDGVEVWGYMHWSIMDNFEWAEGYKERFGLIHVDYATQERTLKASAHWYRELIESNGASLPDVDFRGPTLLQSVEAVR